jgi:hypothetical protein
MDFIAEEDPQKPVSLRPPEYFLKRPFQALTWTLNDTERGFLMDGEAQRISGGWRVNLGTPELKRNFRLSLFFQDSAEKSLRWDFNFTVIGADRVSDIGKQTLKKLPPGMPAWEKLMNLGQEYRKRALWLEYIRTMQKLGLNPRELPKE